jgi:integrase
MLRRRLAGPFLLPRSHAGVRRRPRMLRKPPDLRIIRAMGTKRLDSITTDDVRKLKHRLRGHAPKTVNNVLTLERALPKPSMGFYDFADYEQLLDVARGFGPTAHLVVLLGGEAGLRCGEMIGLQWADVDLVKRQICIQRSEWRGHVTVPKGGRLRYVPMTARLAAALQGHRHLKSKRVLCLDDGAPLTQDPVGEYVRKAGRKANLRASGAHRLRHTFCSHLAIRGAPARAPHGLAGHQDLMTTGMDRPSGPEPQTKAKVGPPSRFERATADIQMRRLTLLAMLFATPSAWAAAQAERFEMASCERVAYRVRFQASASCRAGASRRRTSPCASLFAMRTAWTRMGFLASLSGSPRLASRSRRRPPRERDAIPASRCSAAEFADRLAPVSLTLTNIEGGCPTMSTPGWMARRAVTMAQLAARLKPFAGRPVIDRTNLTGEFAFELRYGPELPPIAKRPVCEWCWDRSVPWGGHRLRRSAAPRRFACFIVLRSDSQDPPSWHRLGSTTSPPKPRPRSRSPRPFCSWARAWRPRSPAAMWRGERRAPPQGTFSPGGVTEDALCDPGPPPRTSRHPLLPPSDSVITWL